MRAMTTEAWREVGELYPRARDRGRRSLGERWRRLRQRFFFIAQCALAAATAWFVAHVVFGHPLPFFAPVTALISLGFSYGQRVRRAFEVMVGVAVGVLVGDLFIHVFGGGVWQLGVIALLAMTLATLLDAGMLVTVQAGVQSIIIAVFLAEPGQAFSRWLDAVIGGSVALVFTLVVPAAPVRRPRQRAAEVVAELSEILRAAAGALRERDGELAEAALARARASESLLDDLRDASAEGVAVVRYSPFRRGQLPGVQAIADLLEPLDRAVRNLRVLVRRAAVATHREERVPGGYIVLLTSLAEVTDEIAVELGSRRLPTGARAGLVRIGELTAVIDHHTGLSGEVMRAQIRSMVVDLLQLTGLSADEAAGMVPDTHSATEARGG